jgi:hypothetical protein
MLEQLPVIAKAIAGGATAAGAALTTALADQVVTGPEWLTVAAAFLAGLGVVYAVPNATPAVEDVDDEQLPPVVD